MCMTTAYHKLKYELKLFMIYYNNNIYLLKSHNIY